MHCLKLFIENQKAVSMFLNSKVWLREKEKEEKGVRVHFRCFQVKKMCPPLLTFSLPTVLHLSTGVTVSVYQSLKMSTVGHGPLDHVFCNIPTGTP